MFNISILPISIDLHESASFVTIIGNFQQSLYVVCFIILLLSGPSIAPTAVPTTRTASPTHQSPTIVLTGPTHAPTVVSYPTVIATKKPIIAPTHGPTIIAVRTNKIFTPIHAPTTAPTPTIVTRETPQTAA